LLARHFDVTRERRMLAAEVERATRSLRDVRAVDRPTAEKAARRVRPTAIARKWPVRSRQPAIVAGFVTAGLVVAAGLGLRSARQSAGPIAAPVPSRAANLVAGPAAPPSAPLAVPSAVELQPAALREAVATKAAKSSARAHALAISARRARPAATKPARPAPLIPAEDLLRRAQDEFDVGETATALALARQAANAGGRSPAHVLMGQALMSERRFDEAEREFAEAVRLDPGDARAARLLALVRDTRSGRP
jgi:tetratricopeptide (TPR) repeat protein